MSVPLYKKALVIGATSGIGQALAAKLISEGTSVIISGRRQDRLDEFIATHGSEKVSAIPLDVTDLAALPQFAKDVIESHPDLECVILNSGIQRAFDFTKPETVDLDIVGTELTTNYLSVVHITTAFLPHLKALNGQGHLVYMSATLGLIPFLIRTPNYNATKAALHAFLMAMRQQLREEADNNNVTAVRIIEVFPPAVQTELHDTKHQPDLVGAEKMGMPLAAFTEKMYEGLVNGQDQFAVGSGEALLREGGWEDHRQKHFQAQNEELQKVLAKYIKQ